MNNQFATQFLMEDTSELKNTVVDVLQDTGVTDEHLIKIMTDAVMNGVITLEKALQIIQNPHVDETTGSGAVGGGSTTGGGVTDGASWDPQGPTGSGEQYAAGTKKKKYQEDAPRLAGDPSKTNKQGSKNLNAYKSVGFTKAPSAQEAGKKLKSIDVKDLWEDEETLNESRAYSKFKKEAATRTKDQQMHEAVKMIHSKLEEISKLVEFAQQMRNELSEGEGALEYKHNTKKVFEKINSKVVEVYAKTKQLK